MTPSIRIIQIIDRAGRTKVRPRHQTGLSVATGTPPRPSRRTSIWPGELDRKRVRRGKFWQGALSFVSGMALGVGAILLVAPEASDPDRAKLTQSDQG
jgi:hypothetical protein